APRSAGLRPHKRLRTVEERWHRRRHHPRQGHLPGQQQLLCRLVQQRERHALLLGHRRRDRVGTVEERRRRRRSVCAQAAQIWVISHKLIGRTTMMTLVFGTVLPWLLLAVGAWLGYQIVRQNGRILLRLEAIERKLGAPAPAQRREAAGL